jgi:Protein of unknown function (DUF3775)
MGKTSRSTTASRREELVKLSEVLRKVITLARSRREYWNRELPKRHRDYPIVHPGEDSGPPPPEEIQLRELLSGLPEDMIYKLIMIMYIGRDGSGVPDVAGLLQEMRRDFPKSEGAVSQMMGKALLDDYLTEGLAKLRNHNIDVDKLLRTSKAGR